jgi:hypothetical protein
MGGTIVWTLATRSRLSNCKRFINSWNETKATSQVYVRLDECDPQLPELLELPWPESFSINTGPRARLGEAMQEMFAKFPNEPWYGMLADDLIPRTEYWDQKLILAAGKNEISYADDLHEKEMRICHPCIGGDLVRFVGFFGLPVVKHFGTDTFWEELYRGAGRQNKQRDVILEHAHFAFDQAPIDQTYTESQLLKRDDKRNYKKWKEEHLKKTIDQVKEHFNW